MCYVGRMVLEIIPGLCIPDDEVAEAFLRAAGPGGQNVNKVESAVQLRFNVRGSRVLNEAVKARLAKLCGQRMTEDGWVVVTAQEHRGQLMNREAARARLCALIKEALVAPKARRKTRRTYGSQQDRLKGKANRAGIKKMRGRVRGEE